MGYEYVPRFGRPGAAAYSVEDVPPADLGIDGDQAWSVNGTVYKKASGVWAPAQSGTSGQTKAVLYSLSASLADITAGHTLVLADIGLPGASGFTLSEDGKTITLPADGAFYVAVLHISVNDGSDGIMLGTITPASAGQPGEASLPPVTGEDYGDGVAISFLVQGSGGGQTMAVTVVAGYGSVTPTKGDYTGFLAIYSVGSPPA